MRACAFACLISCIGATSAAAWAFEETDICTVSHVSPELSVVLTYDPAAVVYTITLSRPVVTWPQSESFRLRFDGARPLIIGTDRHQLSEDRHSISVSDSGFGNVLDGIQFNDAMIALVGDDEISLSTADADAAMQAFRACPTAPVS